MNPNKTMALLTGVLAVAASLVLIATVPAHAESVQLLAFTIYEPGPGYSGGLYISNEDGTGRTRISDAAAGDRPAWSPDAERLAFSGRAPGIWTVRRDGSHPTRISHASTLNGPAGHPAWSPDGNLIAYTADATKLGSIPSFGSQIWTVRTDGSQQRPVSGDEFESAWVPAWSPDSRRIAFTGSAFTGRVGPQIYVMNSDGSGVHRLTTDMNISSIEPAYSPDGTQIAFVQVSYEGQGAWWLAVMNSDGSGLRALTERVEGVSHYAPTWNARGTRIAFASVRKGEMERLEVIDPSGSNRNVLIDADSEDLVPAYSPAINLASPGQASAVGEASAKKRMTVNRRSGAAITGSSSAPGAPGPVAPEVSAREPSPSHAATTPSSDSDAALGIVAISLLFLSGGFTMARMRHRRRIRL